MKFQLDQEQRKQANHLIGACVDDSDRLEGAVYELIALRAQSKALKEALTVSLEAMQKNIAYAMRKDEPALLRGIDAAREVLK